MSQYFRKPFNSHFNDSMKVKIDLSNYATKADIKNISNVDTSSFALKKNLANLKTEVDKLDIDKLKPVPTDLSKLSNVVKNDVVKKTDYNAKIAEIENKIPDTSNLTTTTALTTIENKIPDTNSLVKKTDYNTKIADIEGKIPDISNLATKTALISIENKIHNASSFVTKSSYDTKIKEIKNKYVSNADFNSKLVQANLITKSDFGNKLTNLNRKITKNKSDHVLLENELNKLKNF